MRYVDMKKIFTTSIICLFLATTTYGQLKAESSLTKFLSGQDDVYLILDFYRYNKSLTDDSLYKLLKISNNNYLRTDKKRTTNPDIQFRQITFSDQLFRTKCYVHKLIDYSIVQKNDVNLQNSFIKILQKHPNLNILKNSTYQTTFDLLLIHSVSTLEKGFFINNFYVYSKGFSDNFKDFENLKQLVDIYLKFRYEKQYFGTEYGKGKTSNGTFGLLPKMTENDFKKVLTDLKVNNAVY